MGEGRNHKEITYTKNKDLEEQTVYFKKLKNKTKPK